MSRSGTDTDSQERLGRLEEIYTAPAAGKAMEARDEVRAIPGKGLEGDRYALGEGTWSRPGLWSEVTLVRAEDLEALSAELAREIEGSATRRNLIVREIRDLEDLLGSPFRVGEVVMEGTRPCRPCAHLEETSGISGLRRGLRGRGGLRARLLSEGILRPGDPIVRIT